MIAGGIYNVADATCGSPGCITCCGDTNFGISPNPIFCPIGLSMQCGSTAVDCNGYSVFPSSWSSSNTAVMTANSSGVVTGVSVGSATITAVYSFAPVYTGQICGGQNCPTGSPAPGAPGNVTPTISVSCTPTDLALGPYPPPNTTSGSCSTTVNPSGGTYSWSVNKNTITLSAGTNSATYSAANPSSRQGDTTISVTYTFNNQSATAQSNGITTHNPTALTVLLPDSITGYACTGLQCIVGNGSCNVSPGTCSYNGSKLTRRYDVLDQLNQTFSAVGITSINGSETIPTSTTCPDVGQPSPGSAPSTPFQDSFFMCSRCCLPGGPGCSATTAPTQAILVNGNVVRSEIINWTCSAVSLNP